jgi:hypothetical protein
MLARSAGAPSAVLALGVLDFPEQIFRKVYARGAPSFPILICGKGGVFDFSRWIAILITGSSLQTQNFLVVRRAPRSFEF